MRRVSEEEKSSEDYIYFNEVIIKISVVRKTMRQRDSDWLVQEERTEIDLHCQYCSYKMKKSQTVICFWRWSDFLQLQQFDCETGCDWLLQEERTEIIETIVVIK